MEILDQLNNISKLKTEVEELQKELTTNYSIEKAIALSWAEQRLAEAEANWDIQ